MFDTVRPTSRDTLSAGVDVVYYNYYTGTAGRLDTTYSPHVSWIHALTDKWSTTGQLGYTSNSSTVPSSYSYNAFTIGAGISRAL